MGKMKGPKRKEAPARKRLQAGNSGLVAKQSHRQRNGGVYHSPGINGGSTLGKRSLSQQLLLPNKQGRRGKRRRKGDGPISKPRSSEVAAIQMEYDALDAREKGRKDAEEARRRRAAGEIKLVPASASLRLPSNGDTSMTSLQATSSACMVEALLQSITDDPAPSAAPPSRPIRSAGRKRSGNPYASLGGDSDSDNSDANEPENTVGNASAGGDGRKKKIAFAKPSGVFGGSISNVSGGGSGSRDVGGASQKDIVQVQVASEDDDEDPDL